MWAVSSFLLSLSSPRIHTTIPCPANMLLFLIPLILRVNNYWQDKWERKGNVLFNDALNTFYLQLYGVRHMVKDHSDSERGNMGYSFRLTVRVFLYAPFQT